MLQLIAGIALLVPASVLAACRLHVRGLAPFVLAVLTIAAAIVVGGTVLLSLFGAYRPGTMLLLQIVLLLAVAAWWASGGRPRPAVASLPSPGALRDAASNHKSIAVLVVAAVLAGAVELFLGFAVAPNTWDGLMYHLSRAALWIQNESVLGIDGGTIYQTQHQPNGEMLYGWTLLLLDGDGFVASVQWLAAIGCSAAVFWGSRMLGLARSASLFAAAVFFTLPQVVAQASSTFVDLPAAMFVGAFALFSIRAIRDRDLGDLVVASLAVGLAVGTKGTAFLAAPGVCFILGAALIRWQPSRRQIAIGLAALGIGAFALGSSKYIENVIEVGTPQGTAGDDVTRVDSIPVSLKQTAWTLVDVPGLQGTMAQQVLQDGSSYFFPDGTDPGPGYVSEDWVSYGIIGWLVLVPLVAWFALAPSAPRSYRLVAWAAITYVLAHALIVETRHYAPHTMLTAAMIAAPLLGRVARYAWLRHLIVVVSVLTLVPMLVQNEKKGLWPNWSPGLTRAEQQGLPTAYGESIARIDDFLAPDARIAFVGPRAATWDYPFFGPDLDRYVYRVEAYPEAAPGPDAVAGWASEHDLDAIVWSGVEPPAGTGAERIGKIATSQTAIQLLSPPPR